MKDNIKLLHDLKYLFVLIGLIIICYSVFIFTQNLSEHVEDGIEDTLANTTRYVSNAFHLRLLGQLSNLDSVARFAGRQEDMLHSELLKEYMLDTQISSNYTSIFAMDEMGNNIATDSTALTFSCQEYLSKAMRGDKGISDILIDEVSHKKTVIMYTPIINDNEEIKGALCSYLPFDEFNRSMQISSFDGIGYSYVIIGNGDVIVSPNRDNVSILPDNIFDYFKKTNIFGEITAEMFIDDVKNGKEGFLSFALMGKTHYAYYQPLGINDWYTISEVPREHVNVEIQKLGSIALTLYFGLAIAFMMFVIYIIIGEKENKIHLKESNKELEIKDRRFRLLTSLSNDIIFEWDIVKGTIIFPNGTKHVMDYKPETNGFPEKAVEHGHIHPEDGDAFIRFHRDIPEGYIQINGEFRLKAQEDKYIWCHLEERLLRDERSGKVIKSIGRIVDIDKQKKRLELLEAKMQIDGGSGIYNKVATELQVTDCLQKDKNGNHALIILDIDDFKKVNDTKGHLYGDKIINSVAKTLKKYFRESDIIGRIGGDEFMVLFRDIPNELFVALKMRKILKYINRSYNVTVSAGISLYPKDGTSYYELYHNADQAMYKAKGQNKNEFVFYKDAKRA